MEVDKSGTDIPDIQSLILPETHGPIEIGKRCGLKNGMRGGIQIGNGNGQVIPRVACRGFPAFLVIKPRSSNSSNKVGVAALEEVGPARFLCTRLKGIAILKDRPVQDIRTQTLLHILRLPPKLRNHAGIAHHYSPRSQTPLATALAPAHTDARHLVQPIH
jgi:hypothetical protein